MLEKPFQTLSLVKPKLGKHFVSMGEVLDCMMVTFNCQLGRI